MSCVHIIQMNIELINTFSSIHTSPSCASAVQQLRDRERELVDLHKSRTHESQQATRERKLLSSAFYSLGMEYQSAVMTSRAIPKNGVAGNMMGRVSCGERERARESQ